MIALYYQNSFELAALTNLILVGSASVVKGLSNYLDELLGNRISDFFIKHMSMNIPGLGQYPDLFAFGVIILFTRMYKTCSVEIP